MYLARTISDRRIRARLAGYRHQARLTPICQFGCYGGARCGAARCRRLVAGPPWSAASAIAHDRRRGFPHQAEKAREPVPSARSWVVVMTPAVVEGGGDHAKGVREAHSGHSAPDATVDPWLTWRRRGRLRRRPRSGRRCSGPSPRDGRNNAGPGASASATARAAAVKARASSSRRSTSVCADQAGSTETMCSSRPSGQRRLPVSRRSTTPSRHRAAGRTATTGARC